MGALVLVKAEVDLIGLVSLYQETPESSISPFLHQRTPYEDMVRRQPSASQKDSPLQNQLSRHHDLRLPASRTVTEYISVV